MEDLVGTRAGLVVVEKKLSLFPAEIRPRYRNPFTILTELTWLEGINRYIYIGL